MDKSRLSIFLHYITSCLLFSTHGVYNIYACDVTLRLWLPAIQTVGVVCCSIYFYYNVEIISFSFSFYAITQSCRDVTFIPLCRFRQAVGRVLLVLSF